MDYLDLAEERKKNSNKINEIFNFYCYEAYLEKYTSQSEFLH